MDERRNNVQPSGTGPEFSLTVKRNCSISPRGLLWLLGITAIVSFGIGTAFALFGAWLVLPFAGIEIAALALAFWVNGRHATDYERIELADGILRVEVREASAVREHRFNPGWTRLVVRDAATDPRLALRVHARELEIGLHLDAAGRARLATELRSRLGGGFAR